MELKYEITLDSQRVIEVHIPVRNALGLKSDNTQ